MNGYMPENNVEFLTIFMTHGPNFPIRQMMVMEAIITKAKVAVEHPDLIRSYMKGSVIDVEAYLQECREYIKRWEEFQKYLDNQQLN